ncbi:glycosyltransferase family 4 protein [Ghiorsea bivora]|uniref:glycosyltransferase family 4 protein n=1 Tax=Ghiorsea bivora TaxID=1485545 RepID=UPI0005713E55|nr:glycosyltransferase family 4 protein [Ghiorsea bivora]
MRVMLVVNEFPPEKIAGTAMATKALAEHLSGRGHNVCVLVTTPCPPEKQQAIAAHDYQLVWCKKIPLRGLGWLWRLMQTLQHAKAFQPDVIQGQAVSCGLLAGVAGRVFGVASICYAQGYDVYQASWWQKKTEIRWGCRLPTRCLAVTQNLKQAILDIVDVPVSLMPHAFTLPALSQSRAQLRQQYGLQDDAKLVLNVARLEDFKGQDVLLKAWVAIVAENPKAKLWIAGIGSLEKTLKQIVVTLGLQENVKFLGFVSQAQVHALMEAADLFVLPSREEPFGIVLLEAMAHGLPIVASKVGGIPEVLPSNDDVALVAADDVRALTQAMLIMLANNRLCDDNRVYALDFSWDKQVQRFEGLYTSLLERKQ